MKIRILHLSSKCFVFLGNVLSFAGLLYIVLKFRIFSFTCYYYFAYLNLSFKAFKSLRIKVTFFIKEEKWLQNRIYVARGKDTTDELTIRRWYETFRVGYESHQ